MSSLKRAQGIWQIRCECPPIGAYPIEGPQVPSKGCPKNHRGHRYRGTMKCWGCPHATWWGTASDQRPYGPRRMQPKHVAFTPQRRQSP